MTNFNFKGGALKKRYLALVCVLALLLMGSGQCSLVGITVMDPETQEEVYYDNLDDFVEEEIAYPDDARNI